MKRSLGMALVGTLGLLIGFAGVPLFVPAGEPITGYARASIHARWASSAKTIAEEAAQADTIVRVEVVGQYPVRQIVDPFPPEAQKPGFKEEVIPFTDTRMRVIEVYKGSVESEITVTQMGGVVSATDRHPHLDAENGEDPIYAIGGEHILFLTEVAAEANPPGRKLYHIVNTLGRYDVRGDEVTTWANPSARVALPITVSGLEDELRRVLSPK